MNKITVNLLFEPMKFDVQLEEADVRTLTKWVFWNRETIEQGVGQDYNSPERVKVQKLVQEELKKPEVQKMLCDHILKTLDKIDAINFEYDSNEMPKDIADRMDELERVE